MDGCESEKIKNWEISNQAPNRRRLNDYLKRVGTSVSKWAAL